MEKKTTSLGPALMKEDFSETPLKCCPLKFTYVGKILFIVLALSQKNEFEKWPLITSVQCRSR